MMEKRRRLTRSLLALLVAAGCLLFITRLISAGAEQPRTQTSQSAAPDQSNSAAADRRVQGGGFREPDPMDFGEHTGYVQIFDGKSLKDWDGSAHYWRVEDRAIVGESSKDKPVTNYYLTYRGLEAKDFNLKLEIKVENGGGSGIQYRSKTGLPWRRTARPDEPPYNLEQMLTGPQADFWFPVKPRNFEWTGQFYSENTPLGIIAWRGQVVNSVGQKAPRLVGNIADRAALGGFVKINDWNQYLIMARGGTFIHILNGQLMAVLVDDDPESSNNSSGQIGIELEGFPSKVSVRDIWIRKLS